MKNRLIKTSFLALIVISVSVICSCGSEQSENETIALPNSNGRTGEILVILESEYWEGTLAHTLNNIFGKEVITLPQPEAYFQLARKDPAGFKNSASQHHSILVFEIKSNVKQAYLAAKDTNYYANDQLIYRIYAGNEGDAIKVLKDNAEFLEYEFDKFSRQRLALSYARQKNTSLNEELAITLKVNIDVPSNYSVKANSSSFVWLEKKGTRREDGLSHEIQQGILIYSYPYIDSAGFTEDFVLNKMDTVIKKHVKGNLEGTYLATNRDYIIESSELEVNGEYALKINGLWRMANSIMGGPFVKYSVYDRKNSRIVGLVGYVYAPQFRKMEFMRELDAILTSVRIVN
ncbi:MAG: hypothetical protein ACI9N1_001434 [Flavobacteriales bacterium]|jgi:hypothetical protein